jgi:CYTH domain-containing protein
MILGLPRPLSPNWASEIQGALMMMGVYMSGGSQDVLRVSINDDETFDITDFALPSEGDKVRKNIPQEDMPQWVLESISMLRIADVNHLVDGLGFKINDRLYFLQDKRGQANESSA